jgi:cell division septation protein DedD
MERKKLLWATLAVGILVLVVVGAGILVLNANKAKAALAAATPSPAPAEPTFAIDPQGWVDSSAVPAYESSEPYATLPPIVVEYPDSASPSPGTTPEPIIAKRSSPSPEAHAAAKATAKASPSPKVAKKPAKKGPEYYIQLASYPQSADAATSDARIKAEGLQKWVRELNIGFSANVLIQDDKAKGMVYFRVRIGPFAAEADARRIAETIKGYAARPGDKGVKGLDAYIVVKVDPSAKRK